VYLLGFQAYIKEMGGSRIKIASKILVKQRCAEGFNSGVKGLSIAFGSETGKEEQAARLRCRWKNYRIYAWNSQTIG
jgi:hypothetical protein